MELTKEYLKTLYAHCNEKYFNNQLGKCEFSFFTKNNPAFGSYLSTNDSKGRPNDKIWIGTAIYWTEEILERILVHEMVHMYVYRIEKCRHDGVLGHGWRFRRQRRRILKEHGLDILDFSNIEFKDKKFVPKLWEKVLLWLIDR